jgi:predicted MFS family arabinose efflux permease
MRSPSRAGVLKVFFDLAYAARVQSLVEPAFFAAANSRLSLSRSVSFVAGPGVAGVLVQLIGPPLALLADAASFAASAALVATMRAPEPESGHTRSGLSREIREGISFTIAQPVLRPFYLWTTAMNFFNYVYSAIYLLYLVRALHLPPALIGIPLGVAGVGAVLGSLLATPVARRLGIGRACMLGEIMFTAGYLAVPLVSSTPQVEVAFISAGALVTGVGLMLLDTNSSTIFQSLVPTALMGRAQAATRQVNWGIRPLGALAGPVRRPAPGHLDRGARRAGRQRGADLHARAHLRRQGVDKAW